MSHGAAGYQLKLRLFLEGIEVPVIGAQVQMNLNAPATASIQVIPTDRIMELKPRTMVHLFFWDYTKDLPDAPDSLGIDSAVAQQERVANQEDSSDPEVQIDNYKLLFGGEIVGLVMSKNAINRQAVLQCADWSTYWDTSYQTFISYSPNGNFLSDRSSMWAGGNNLFNNIMSSHSGVMSSFLKKRPKSPGLQQIQGLMGGIISLLEAMGGVPTHVSGINDYFTISELKNHLMQQITAEQNDSTAQRLFSGKAFDAWLNSRASGLGELVSFRDMLKLLFHWIYYEVVPVPAAYYVPSVASSSKTITKKTRSLDTRDLTNYQLKLVRDMIRTSKKYDGSLGEELTFDNQALVDEAFEAKKIRDSLRAFIEGTAGQESRSTTHTGGRVETIVSEGSGLLTPRARQAAKDAEFCTRFIVNIKTRGEIVNWRREVDHLRTDDPKNPVYSYTQKAATEPPSAFPQWRKNQKSWAKLTSALIKILGVKGQTGTKSKTYRKKAEVDRLQTQIFRPDCFFVPPPKCNVLFPDQYVQFQFQRNFLQEVTRLRLTTGLQFLSGKGSGFFNHSHFAPSLQEVKRLAASQGNRGIRTLLPWEKHTGILPKFEHISEINYQANKKQRQLTRDVKGEAKSFGQRTANFNFLKYRFAPRSMSVQARFNPFFVLGFPALVIDKPFILTTDEVSAALLSAGVQTGESQDLGTLLENIGSIAKYFKAPTQYLGMPAAVSHMADQQGGVTAITLTHARQHRITDDDFLRSWSAEVTKRKEASIETTVLDAAELLARGDYKGLRLLVDATPQDILSQLERGLPQDAQPAEVGSDSADDTHLGSRSNGAPNLSGNPSLAPFLTNTSGAAELLLNSNDVQLLDIVTKNIDSFDGSTEYIRLRGGTAKALLEGTRTEITVPSPHGKLKPKDKGPRGGRIVHIQVLGDSVVEVSSVDMSSFAKSRKQKKDLKLIVARAKKKSLFIWRKVVIHEEVSVTKKAKVTRAIPIEEAIRPPWFSPLYSNLLIGPHIYEQFFGVGSIVDQSLFLTPEGDAFFSTSKERKDIMAAIDAADGDPIKVSKILEDNKGKTLADIPDIETAVDALAFIYGEVRRQNLDVHRFIANYTSRPIATMRDMFGSLDLEYRQNGSELELVQGTPGFHSTAVAPFGQLLGLTDNPDLELSRIKKTAKKFPISRDLDPRPERRTAVLNYAAEVSISRGSLGTGLLG